MSTVIRRSSTWCLDFQNILDISKWIDYIFLFWGVEIKKKNLIQEMELNLSCSWVYWEAKYKKRLRIEHHWISKESWDKVIITGSSMDRLAVIMREKKLQEAVFIWRRFQEKKFSVLQCWEHLLMCKEVIRNFECYQVNERVRNESEGTRGKITS